MQDFKIKAIRNSWVKNNKNKRNHYTRFSLFFNCFVKNTGEVKMAITFEPNMQFEWDKRHVIEKYLLLHLNPGGVVTTPLENFSLPPPNQKESDQSHLGNLNYILCGHFDGKKLGVPPSGRVG